MSTSTVKRDHARADVLPTAEKFLAAIEPYCVECQIAGSLRRQRTYVGDIEIVAIPIRPLNLFDEIDEDAPTVLDRTLADWENAGRARIEKNGPRYKKLSLLLPDRARIAVDLFVTTPVRWPITLALRTGPASYSQQIVTQRAYGGLLQNGCRVSDSQLWQERTLVPLRDERHFFEYVQGGFVQPMDRGR